MADDRTSGESTSNEVGSRRRAAALPKNSRQRGSKNMGDADQNGEDDRNSVHSSRSGDNHRRDNRPP